MSLQIKEATLGNINNLVPLFNAYRIFYEQPGDIEGTTDFLYERISKKESTIFIAFLNNEVVLLQPSQPVVNGCRIG